MFNELKELPEENKRLIRRTIMFSSMTFLIIAGLLWYYKEDAMEFLGFDAFMVDLLAALLCAMVIIDLVMVKILFGEDKAK